MAPLATTTTTTFTALASSENAHEPAAPPTSVECPGAPTDAELAERLQRLSRHPTEPGRRRKHRHAAKKSRIAALAFSLVSTAGLTGAFAATDGPSSAIMTASGGIVTDAGPTVVNGDVFTNKWGPVQVQVSFGANGRIASVDAVQVPFVDGKSVRINNRAVPELNRQVLSAQTAKVDTVSGATYTSSDYERSLQSAIDAARAAGLTNVS